MTNENQGKKDIDIDAELRQVPVEEPTPKTEISPDDQYLVEYVQTYAAQQTDGRWYVHVVIVWGGDEQEIIFDAADAKALSGGVAMANSYIMKEKTKDRFTRKKAPKSSD